MGQTAGANAGFQQAQANEMNAAIANQQTTANLLGTLGNIAGNIDFSGGGQTTSEARTTNTFELDFERRRLNR